MQKFLSTLSMLIKSAKAGYVHNYFTTYDTCWDAAETLL